MHYAPNFCGCHFVPKLPLGHLSNSKIHGGLWCKRWENKICKDLHAKDAMLMREIKWKWGKFKHAIVEIKYEITTNLPVGKGSKFKVFWTRHFVPSTLISLTKNSKLWHRFAKVIGKICTLMWCSGCSGSSFGSLLIGLNFSWYISSHGTAPKVRSRNYLPGLHRDVVLSRLMQCSLLLVIW